MRKLRLPAIIGLCGLMFLLPAAITRADSLPLEKGFADPPLGARARAYWWWLNGNVTKPAITRDLEEMKAKGMGGAMIFDAGGANLDANADVPAGPLFGSPAWRELFKHTLTEASRLGLEIDLNITSGWNLGGPTVTPETAMKRVAWTETPVTGPKTFDDQLPTPKTVGGFYRDVAVIAYLAAKSGPKPVKWFAEKALFKELGGEFGGFSAPDATPLLQRESTEPEPGAVDPDTEIDLTAKLGPDGKLTCDIPAGDWVILRLGYTLQGAKVSTGSAGWTGYSLDHMSTPAFENYWRQVVDPLMQDAGPLAGKTFTRLQTDSWEMGVINWTDRFPEEFKTRRGYDLRPYLPAMAGRIVISRDVTDRFLYDLRRTVADCIADRHYRAFAAKAAEHGMSIQCESGGPHGAPIDALLCMGIDDIPMGEFWAPSWTHRTTPASRFFLKQAACAAHVYGHNRACGEAFTSIGPHWTECPFSLKSAFDTEACEGLNLIYWHAFVCSPEETGLPGQQYFAGTHLNPKVTWWDSAGAFFAYLDRCQYMLQQGLFVADALYYYGDDVPNFVRMKSSDPAKVLPGCDYDVCNEDVLLNRASVKDGRIVLPDGMSYRVLVLPGRPMMPPAVLTKVTELVNAGATVIGPKPAYAVGLTDYPASDKDVARRADELWGKVDGKKITQARVGAGRIVYGQTAKRVLSADGIGPDFETDAPGKTPIDYIHRATPDDDIYFVANLGDAALDLRATFRIAGKTPELWLPDTGETRKLFVYESKAGRTSLPLHFDARGSVFVVFRGGAGAPVATGITRGGAAVSQAVAEVIDADGPKLLASEAGDYELHAADGSLKRAAVAAIPAAMEIAGPWGVTFASPIDQPSPANFDRLASLTENPDRDIKFFSGTATYKTTIVVPIDALAAGRRWSIDLGDVREIARVRINDQDLGILWHPPFRTDVTASLKPGPNAVEIAVTNLWPNRLIGDAGLPPADRKTRTNIQKFKPETPLLPSGLLGPVKLTASAEVVIP